jgi:hypothetical protein
MSSSSAILRSGVSKTADECCEFYQLPSACRGNPNWGDPMLPASVLATEFDLQVRKLGLTQSKYASSLEL